MGVHVCVCVATVPHRRWLRKSGDGKFYSHHHQINLSCVCVCVCVVCVCLFFGSHPVFEFPKTLLVCLLIFLLHKLCLSDQLQVPERLFIHGLVLFGVNAPRRAWFFPRLCSLVVYVFNALADCKMTLPKTRCPTLLLTSCYLDREGGWGGMITFLSTVRWRYRRHVAQLCCWRLATLTGRGGGGVGGGW